MFAKTLIATATAAVIAAGTMAATTGTASATYKYSGGHYVTKVVYVPKKVCEPYYKTIKWHDYYGWHTKTVYAGEKCYTINVKAYQKVWVPYVYFKAPHFSFSYGY